MIIGPRQMTGVSSSTRKPIDTARAFFSITGFFTNTMPPAAFMAFDPAGASRKARIAEY